MIAATKNRSLIAIIIFLLITNIAMLVFFLGLTGPGKRMHSREDGIASFLKKDINFNDKQIEAYKLLKDKHIENIKPLFESIRSAKDSFYNLLYRPNVTDSILKERAMIIGNKQTDLDLKMMQHLKNVRAICNAEQLTKFDSLFKNVVQRFTHGKFGKAPDSKR